MHLVLITQLTIIMSLNNSSPGYDGIPGKIIKAASDILAPIIAHLCNQSLATGVFPNSLKIAVVRPIFKSGIDIDINNYLLKYLPEHRTNL